MFLFSPSRDMCELRASILLKYFCSTLMKTIPSPQTILIESYCVLNTDMIAKAEKEKVEIFNNTNNMNFILLNKFSLPPPVYSLLPSQEVLTSSKI